MNIQYVIIKEDYVLTIIELLTGHISSILPLSFLYLKNKGKEDYFFYDYKKYYVLTIIELSTGRISTLPLSFLYLKTKKERRGEVYV